jgi:hypothetical protein
MVDASTKGVRAIAQAGKMGIFCFLKKELTEVL